MSDDFAVLLSLVIDASGGSEADKDAEFRQAMSCYSSEAHVRVRAGASGSLNALQQAFDRLYTQPLATREAFVAHCREIVFCDGIEMPDEQRSLWLIRGGRVARAAAAGCLTVARCPHSSEYSVVQHVESVEADQLDAVDCPAIFPVEDEVALPDTVTGKIAKSTNAFQVHRSERTGGS